MRNNSQSVHRDLPVQGTIIAKYHHTLYNAKCRVYCALYTVHCTLCTVHCALYTVNIALNTVFCTLQPHRTVYFHGCTKAQTWGMELRETKKEKCIFLFARYWSFVLIIIFLEFLLLLIGFFGAFTFFLYLII